MRKIQITIQVDLFDQEKTEKVTVYTDSNNLWECIVAAFEELIKALRKKGRLLSTGAKEHTCS